MHRCTSFSLGNNEIRYPESIVENNATNDFDTCCNIYSTSKGQPKGTNVNATKQYHNLKYSNVSVGELLSISITATAKLSNISRKSNLDGLCYKSTKLGCIEKDKKLE